MPAEAARMRDFAAEQRVDVSAPKPLVLEGFVDFAAELLRY